MTVKDLIEMLRKENPKSKVKIFDPRIGWKSDVDINPNFISTPGSVVLFGKFEERA